MINLLKNWWHKKAQTQESVGLRQYAAQSPRQKMGESGELMARTYLEQQGLRYLGGNIASNLGEIDLLMRQGETVVFVEVKWRKSGHYGGAIVAITPHKLQKLRRTIELFLQQHPHYAQQPCRIDAVLIQGVADDVQIQWLQNIAAD